jgi:hypothetical protein
VDQLLNARIEPKSFALMLGSLRPVSGNTPEPVELERMYFGFFLQFYQFRYQNFSLHVPGASPARFEITLIRPLNRQLSEKLNFFASRYWFFITPDFAGTSPRNMVVFGTFVLFMTV